jgi:hypothetical protein
VPYLQAAPVVKIPSAIIRRNPIPGEREARE